MSDIQSSLNLENNARNRESDLVKDTLKAIENFQYLLKTLHSEIQHALRNQYQKTFFQHFFKLGFTPWKSEKTLRGMELQENKAQKD